jgi:hypothetical protein
MDYAEHERTYGWFLWLTKWSIVFLVVLLISMAVGFFTNGGWVGGALLFVILMIGSIFVL